MSTQQMEEQLWNYIDGTAGAKDISYVESMIAADPTWLAKYNELLEVNSLLKTEMELEQPSLRFTKNVMEQLNGLQPARPTKAYINKYIVRAIAFFFILTIGALLIYGFAGISWQSTSQTVSLPFDLKKADWFQFNFNKIFSGTFINIFIMINIVLGLSLVDFYLRKRKLSSGKK